MKMIEKVALSLGALGVTIATGVMTMKSVEKKAKNELEELHKKEVLEEEDNKKIEKLEKRMDKLNKVAEKMSMVAAGVGLTGVGLTIAGAVKSVMDEKDNEETEEVEEIQEIEELESIEPNNNGIEIELEVKDGIEFGTF